MNIPAPKKEELSNYYQSYLGYLTEQNLLDALNSQSNVTSNLLVVWRKSRQIMHMPR